MKATGIVRRIDDLGRVVIPREIRNTMRIREGDPLEIFIESDGSVIFKKYSYFGDFDYKKAMNILKPILQGVTFAIYNNYCDYTCSTDRASFSNEFNIKYDKIPETCYEIRALGDLVGYLYIKDEISEDLKNTAINVLKEYFKED